MRAFLAVALFLCPLVACGGNGDDDGGDDEPPRCIDGTDKCPDTNCIRDGLPDTSLTGRVFAPNGTLPLFGVNVYIPSEVPGPFPEGAQCSRCTDPLLGRPITQTQTDDNGNFTLINVPVGEDIPLVVTTGKWRRQITISNVERCKATAIPEAETRLPKNKSEGDIPKIAITTGDADSMECLPRKLGVDDTEITRGDGPGRIHLYAGNGVPGFNGTFPGSANQPLSSATGFWGNADLLKSYDVVILSCEGGQLPANNGASPKLASDLAAVKAYADLGGRVFISHWHNIWLGGAFQANAANPNPDQAAWTDVSEWTPNDSPFDGTDTIDEGGHAKGPAFASWMMNVGASTRRGEFLVTQGKRTSTSLQSRAERWVSQGSNPQMFQFTTPLEQPVGQSCGKVVFTDMHVSGQRNDGNYPDSCVPNATDKTLTAQEKALAFMFFDISSCVGGVF